MENMRHIGCSTSRAVGIYAEIGKLAVAHDVVLIANRAPAHLHRPVWPEHDVERRLWLLGALQRRLGFDTSQAMGRLGFADCWEAGSSRKFPNKMG
jgi:hypothetical protein